jgi:hypothetical protein
MADAERTATTQWSAGRRHGSLDLLLNSARKIGDQTGVPLFV